MKRSRCTDTPHRAALLMLLDVIRFAEESGEHDLARAIAQLLFDEHKRAMGVTP